MIDHELIEIEKQLAQHKSTLRDTNGEVIQRSYQHGGDLGHAINGLRAMIMAEHYIQELRFDILERAQRRAE